MNNKRNKFKKLFLTSLLLHTVLFIIFIIFGFKKGPKPFQVVFLEDNDFPKEEKKLVQMKELAELKPKKSMFGATTFYDEIPQFTPAISPIISDRQRITKETKIKKQSEKITSKIKPEITENLEEKIKGKAQENIIHKDEQKTSIEFEEKNKDKFINKLEQDLHTTTTYNIAKNQIDELAKTGNDKINQEEIDSAEISESTDIIRQLGTDRKDASPAPKPKRSILQITSGYLYNAKNEGEYWIRQYGKKNAMPDFSQLQEKSYDEKIEWYFQQESGIKTAHMSRKESMHLMDGYKCKPAFFISISKNGNINKVKLVRSSGSNNYDNYLSKTLKTMSAPPIPKHLCKKYNNKYEKIYNINNK